MNLQMIRAERLVNARQRGMLAADFVAALSDADRKAAFVEWLRRRSGAAWLAAEDSALLLAMIDRKAARDSIFASSAASAVVASHSGAMSVVAGSAAAMVDALSSSVALAAMLAVPAAKDALMSSTALAKASVPKMTSNTAPSGVASAKTIYAPYAAGLAFDGNDVTYWNSAGASAGEWIQYQFPSDVFVHSMTVTNVGSKYAPKDCVLQKSVDGVTFVDVKAMTLPEDGVVGMDVASAGFCKYWRLSISSDYGAGLTALRGLNFAGFVKP